MTRRPVDLERAERAVADLLAAVGLDRDADPELADTPSRAAHAFAHELLGGYDVEPAAALADCTSADTSDLVVVRDIQLVTMCPHHLLPARGLAHVGYVPHGKVVGLGALARLVDAHARRLVLQEELGRRIAEALVVHLGARGAGVVLDTRPMCLVARGEKQHAARAVTVSLAGSFALPDGDRALFALAMGGAATEGPP
ncbi:MAG: GTP cyclohydrolase I FolE [Deltaproteobacteria bacterium]|nr:GTP cyclohydrolase I FolE [Deltaproteobacteria bacterium]